MRRALAAWLWLATSPTAWAQNQAVHVGNNHLRLTGLDAGPAYTIEAWQRRDTTVTGAYTVLVGADATHFSRVSIQHRSTSSNRYWLGEIMDGPPGGTSEGWVCPTDTTHPNLCAPRPYALGHVALVVNATDMRLYIDGVEAAATSTGVVPDWTGVTLALGMDDEASTSWNSDPFYGVLDEVRIWDVARSQADIACTKDRALTGKEAHLVALWDLDGDPADATPNDHDFTWFGTPEYVASPFSLTPTPFGSLSCLDGDGDGKTPGQGDCDDTNPDRYPGAVEVVGNEIDENCDGKERCYADADDDGWIAESLATVLGADSDCDDPGEASANEITTDLDCNDSNDAVNPVASEVPGNEVDDDCDGTELCFVDVDGDGYLPAGQPEVASADPDCQDPGEAPMAATAFDADCSDADASIHPDADDAIGDQVDADCDGTELCYVDADNDGFVTASLATVASTDSDCADPGEARAAELAETNDCDDAKSGVRPNATEAVGDEVDQNCDGFEACYVDADDDGHAVGGTVVSGNASCRDPGEALATDPRDDCNDLAAAIRPGATETVGDEVDQNCDGAELCYVDVDGDDFRTNATVASANTSCADAGEAVAGTPGNDCNDGSTAVRPDAIEVAGDEVDQNCDGSELCFADADGDGYRTSSTVVSSDVSCAGAGEAVAADPSGDCNDLLAAIRPGATETVGDEVDQNCDGTELCYIDADGDGHAIESTVVSANASCGDPGEALASEPRDDCNDGVAAIRPGVSEAVGDEVDQNCDGSELCFADTDDDGYRTSSTVVSSDTSCGGAGEAVAADPSGDCNDLLAAIRPGAAETVGDEVDQNCDGTELCYVDADGDGFRTNATVASANGSCADPGEARADAPGNDCNDGSVSVRPDATEVVGDEIDSNCDGAELCWLDGDDDGFLLVSPVSVSSSDLRCDGAREEVSTAPRGDCDDLVAAVHPGATEGVADGVDQDCDGKEVCYVDGDGDGYVVASKAQVVSSDPDCDDDGEARASQLSPPNDCDDTAFYVHPGVAELCDGIDNDCNLVADDGVTYVSWYRDADEDGYGRTLDVVSDCRPLAGRVLVPGDCDDADPDVNPDPLTLEIPGDEVDQNCDRAEDCYVDLDGDGFARDDNRTVSSADLRCDGPGEASLDELATTNDCDDARADVNPLEEELPGDGLDSDCDRYEVCFVDADGDGFAPVGHETVLSARPTCDGAFELAASELDVRDDCDDARSDIHPGAAETPGDEVDADCDGGDRCYLDQDGDGFVPTANPLVTSVDPSCDGVSEATADQLVLGVDCNDLLTSVHPGAEEVPGNEVDEDCDGAEVCFADPDGDGFIVEEASTRTSADAFCDASGEVPWPGSDGPWDCNDGDGDVWPGASEVTGNEVDDDCDGAELCYRDADGDGFVDRTLATVESKDLSCRTKDGAAREAQLGVGLDCDDGVAEVHPGAVEVPGDEVDQDCDGKELCWSDADGDGYAGDPLVAVPSADVLCDAAGELALETEGLFVPDCDDARSEVAPGKTDLPGDGVDTNCDGLETCYVDADVDGWVAVSGGALVEVVTVDATCSEAGHATSLAVKAPNDCDDADPYRSPSADERPGDGVDQDCDGSELCWLDADNDGFLVDEPETVVSADLACVGKYEGRDADRDLATDCDDGRVWQSPNAEELPGDGVDSDCDGFEDCFVDADDDGYLPEGEPAVGTTDIACAGEGLATDEAAFGDCDDLEAGIHPEAVEEVGDGIDEDCDGEEACYVDADLDGYPASETVSSEDLSCSGEGQMDDEAADLEVDCDDDHVSIGPGASKEGIGDGVDQDCDGWERCYVDADDDGFVVDTLDTVESRNLACDAPGEAPADFLASLNDCDDEDRRVNPAAAEVPGDDVDQDCDGSEVCYVDADRDRYVGSAEPVEVVGASCDRPGYGRAPEGPIDCDDGNLNVHPSAVEAPGDEVDANCDGMELCWVDADQDGFAPAFPVSAPSLNATCDDPGELGTTDLGETDCDDEDPDLSPDADEKVGDGVDQDCDGIEICYLDRDEDGFFVDTPPTGPTDDLSCEAVGHGLAEDVVPPYDCDDKNELVYPGAEDDWYDGVDADCDGRPDHDRDGDGFTAADGDCDDADGAVRPDATDEPDDGIDGDCDGADELRVGIVSGRVLCASTGWGGGWWFVVLLAGARRRSR